MSMLSWFWLNERERKNFFWLLLVYGLYVLPLILADTYYLDDIGRAANGYAAWELDGRPVTMLVIDALNFQWTFLDGIALTMDGIRHPIQDLAPYPMLLGIVIFAYAVVLLSRKYLRTKSFLILIACQTLCILNPFMLENIAFRFDCVTMFLAAALTLLCFSLPDEMPPRKMLLWSFVLSFLVLGLYQALIGAYIALTAFELLVVFYRSEAMQPVLHRCVARLAGLFAAGILYKFTVAKFLLGVYGQAHSSFLSPFSRYGWELLRQNIHTYHELLRSYTDSLPWVVGGAMFVLFLLFSWQWFRRCRLGGRTILIYAVGTFIALFGAYLPMLALEAPVVNARTLIFLIVIPVALGFMTCALAERRKVIALLLIPLLMYGFYYVYAFGNVLKRQAELDSMFAQQIAYDINRLDYEGGHPGRTATQPTVTIIGSAPSALERLIAAKRQPLMSYMIQPHMREKDRGWVLVRHAVPFDFMPGIGSVEDEDRSYAASHAPEISNATYALYLNGSHIIVKFQ